MPRPRKLIVVRRIAHPRSPWAVFFWEADTQRRRYFATEREAVEFRRTWQREQVGRPTEATPLTPSEWRAVLLAREKRMALERLVVEAAQARALSSVTVAEAIRQRLEGLQGQVSRKHFGDAERRLQRFAATFGSRLLSAVSAMDITRWIASIEGEPRTRHHHFAALRALFREGHRMGWIRENPVAAELAPRVPKAQAIGIVTPAEMRALLAALDPAFRPAVAIAGFAGLRKAEMQRLHWPAVHVDRGFIEVGGSIAKTGDRRLVHIEPALAAFLGGAPTEGPVEPPNFRKTLDAAKRAAGFGPDRPWPQNALRHSFASYHLAHHQDAARTALELGHRGTATLFVHYRELVTREAAAEWWGIRPPGISEVTER